MQQTKNTTMMMMSSEFVYDLMSVPTSTGHEQAMIAWIEDWAANRGITTERDAQGNLYLTKGVLAEGEYYPGFTSHLDTVQHNQAPLVENGERLEIVTKMKDGQHHLHCQGTGIGADCKSGIAICLSIMDKLEKAKCLFFVGEEACCEGSKNMDKSQLKNVGYVMGFDSPELNRAAWACNGTVLFDASFFKTFLERICRGYGLTEFFSEPYTDVMFIRQHSQLACMNFGNGGYLCHSPYEYCVMEEMDHAAQMGLALTQVLGNNRHMCKLAITDEDEAFLRRLGGFRVS